MKTDEMCEIMECVQQYVPHVKASYDFINPITEDVMKETIFTTYYLEATN